LNALATADLDGDEGMFLPAAAVARRPVATDRVIVELKRPGDGSSRGACYPGRRQ
jgi:hypothetical protein